MLDFLSEDLAEQGRDMLTVLDHVKKAQVTESTLQFQTEEPINERTQRLMVNQVRPMRPVFNQRGSDEQ